MPHWPPIGNDRCVPAPIEGGPKAPVNPLPRVSATRHGVIGMKGTGGVSESVVTPLPRGGVHVAGARQFAIVSPPRARLARRNEARDRDARLRVCTEDLLVQARVI